jgi:hypothetical protein
MTEYERIREERRNMEAKDTVMSEKEWLEIWYSGDDERHLKVHNDYLSGLIRQAEISFKAGIEEVMEWIRTNKSCRSDFMTPGEFYFRINEVDWQAFQKSKGL